MLKRLGEFTGTTDGDAYVVETGWAPPPPGGVVLPSFVNTRPVSSSVG